jgi:hypothetical protein
MTDAKTMPSERLLRAYNSGYGDMKETRAILDELWLAVFPAAVSEVRGGGDAVEMIRENARRIYASDPIAYPWSDIAASIEAERAEAQRRVDREAISHGATLDQRDAAEYSLAAELRAHGETKKRLEVERLDLSKSVTELDGLRTKLEAADRELGRFRDGNTIEGDGIIDAQLRAQSNDGLRDAVNGLRELVLAQVRFDKENAVPSGDIRRVCLQAVADQLGCLLAEYPAPSPGPERQGDTEVAEVDVALPHRETHPVVRKSELTELQSRIDRALSLLHGEQPDRDKWSAWGRGFLDDLISALDGTFESAEVAK